MVASSLILSHARFFQTVGHVDLQSFMNSSIVGPLSFPVKNILLEPLKNRVRVLKKITHFGENFKMDITWSIWLRILIILYF